MEDRKGDQREIRNTLNSSEIDSDPAISYTAAFDHVFVSLNRYERKKNVTLAIDAFHLLKTESSTRTEGSGAEYQDLVSASYSAVLVVAGGYDVSVPENVEHLRELIAHTTSLGLSYMCTAEEVVDKGGQSREAGTAGYHVVFRTSISGHERELLLNRADALLYTPDRYYSRGEHHFMFTFKGG